MTAKILKSFFLIAACVAVSACSRKDDSVYANTIYFDITSGDAVTDIPVSINDSASFEISLAVPMKTDVDVKADISIDESMVKEFNIKYGEDAVILPEEYYSLSRMAVEIPSGNVISPKIKVSVKDLLRLDVKKKKTYVLPLVISQSNLPISSKHRAVKYFFLHGASLVNVVPYLDGRVTEDGNTKIDDGNYIKIDWKDKSLVKGWDSFTYEALAIAEFTQNGHKAVPDNISGLMGSENGILIRWWRNSSNMDGNIGVKKAKYLGLVISQKETTETYHEFMLNDETWVFPDNEWTALTVTYDKNSSELKTYLNGALVKTQVLHKHWDIEIYPEGQKEPEFYIGHCYNSLRWWPGCVCEVRVWKRALTEEEIADPIHPYFVDPSTAEGLVGYWKCCEGTGNVVKDYSGNGNNGESFLPIKWKTVALPEEESEE